MMNLSRKGVVAAFSAGLALAIAVPAMAGEGDVTMKPKQGVSFEVGSKHAIAYYLAKGGICDLTVLMAESNELDSVKGAATRVTIPVIPTRAARIDNAEGKTMQFSCEPSAVSMTISVLDQVAAAQQAK
ncbi:MAG: hypothetical protein JNM89_14000 [Hyphomicrobiaceae bacterium]|nr:hypothetical protein [Hyphomicrobiaceae bacterium]